MYGHVLISSGTVAGTSYLALHELKLLIKRDELRVELDCLCDAHQNHRPTATAYAHLGDEIQRTDPSAYHFYSPYLFDLQATTNPAPF